MEFNTVNNGYSFGISGPKIVAELRRLAYKIETGKIILKSVRAESYAPINDWTENTLTISYNSEAVEK